MQLFSLIPNWISYKDFNIAFCFLFFSVFDKKKPHVVSTRQAMTIQATSADGRSKRYAYFTNLKFINFAIRISKLLYNIPLSLS